MAIIYHYQSIFERHLLQKVRQEKDAHQQALQEAKKAYGEQVALVRNLNHDIRVLLNGLLGFAHILASTTNLSAKCHREAGETIRETSTQLLELINNLLAIARLESRKMSLHWHTISAQELVQAHDWQPLEAELSPTHTLEVRSSHIDQDLLTDYGHVRKIIELIITDIVRKTAHNHICIYSFYDPGRAAICIDFQAELSTLSPSAIRAALDTSKQMSHYTDAHAYYLVQARMIAQLIQGELLFDEQMPDAVHLQLYLPIAHEAT